MANSNKNIIRFRLMLFSFLVLIVVVSGCATTATSVRAHNRAQLVQLSPGMQKSEVISLMGAKTIEISYKRPDGRLAKELITNPYRSETISTLDDVFAEVLFYFTDLKKDDGAITDDELTPLFFEDGVLVGWGWSFAEANVTKYENRLR